MNFNYKKSKSKLWKPFSFLAMLILMFGTTGLYAQLPTSNDYENYGVNSTTAATLEYDNLISVFHSSAARTIDNKLVIWGYQTAANGTGSLLVPTVINTGNFPGYSGHAMKVAMGSIRLVIKLYF